VRRIAVLLLVLTSCATSSKDRKAVELHEALAQQNLAAGDPHGALGEVEKALLADPKDPEALNLHGLILHLSFHKTEEAAAEYRKALAVKPDDSQVKVNLAAALTELGRCKEALPVLEEARRDMLYREPYLVENNLGWCKYQLGDAESALQHLKASVSLDRKFCLGYRNLAEIYGKLGKGTDERESLDRYAKACPDVADAHYRIGIYRLAHSDSSGARSAFASCMEKGKGSDLAEECRRQAEMIPGG
jgi:Tfp pilus assembly protein PilF